MKKYVFVSRTVFGIGGGQLYIANKVDYLARRDYSVSTVSTSIHSVNGTIFYNSLKQADNHVFTDLTLPPEVYSLKKRNKIINNVIDTLGLSKNDEIILESNYLVGSIWAERIAEQLECKHIVFCVSEHNKIDRYMCEFSEFKFRRGELSSISAKSFSELIAQSAIVNADNLPILRAYLGDPISDEKNEKLEEIEKSDYNICIIGRGGKRYVDFACESVIDFCKCHPDIYVTVGLVSQFSDSENFKKIKDAFLSVSNIKFYHLGYLSPIPKDIFKLFDLYIGGAGCASLCYRQGVLTIAMDLYNDRPIGFMGYDTCITNCISSESSNMQEYLEDAIIRKEYLKKEYTQPIIITEEEAFSLHDKFIKDSSSEKNYYTKPDKSISLKEKIKAKFPFLIKLRKMLK